VRATVIRHVSTHVRLRQRFSLGPRRGAARLIAQRNEERRHVLAVPVDFRKRWARALGREACRRELKLDVVRLRLRAAYVTACGRITDLDLVDGVAPHVIVAAKEGPSAEKAAKRSVVERGDRVRER
jgi:hypothetical protein